MTNPSSANEVATNAQKSVGGLARIGKAFGYSLQGLRHAMRFEAAFRQELLVAVPAMIGLCFLPVSAVEKLVLLASVLLVLIVELLNSAIEAVVDRVSTERHPLSGRAKDMGSAAVLLAVIFMIAAWAMIVGPLLVGMLSN